MEKSYEQRTHMTSFGFFFKLPLRERERKKTWEGTTTYSVDDNMNKHICGVDTPPCCWTACPIMVYSILIKQNAENLRSSRPTN